MSNLRLDSFLITFDAGGEILLNLLLSLLVLDDLGYVKKSEAETAVLFELIAHRYERKSLLIAANQSFSQWDAI